MTKYYWVIQLKHPRMHPDLITSALDWEPSIVWVAGEPRKTLTGIPLDGVYPVSAWSDSEWEDSAADFFAHMLEIVGYLEERREFIVGFVRSGGSAALTVQLPGDCTTASRLAPEGMRRLAALGVTLGVEAFPGMK